MKKFMDNDFLLNNETGKKLYQNFAKNMPIIDYHCHINPRAIYEDHHFDNITQVWLEGDHYKWRAMRSCGIDEKYITGEADDYEKFCKFAETLELAIGNPLYHWSHMELKKYFGYDGILNTKTAENVWNICNNVLVNEQLSVRKIIKQSNVEVICTTDEPIDSLQWHKKVEEDGFEVKVLPAWRPDKIVNIEKDDFAEYIKKLGAISNISIKNVKSLKSSIKERIIYFSSMGCSISDHGLDFIPYSRCPENELEEIFIKALNHKAISTSEVEKYKTEILIFLAAEYKERNWVMQLHYGCHRNNNTIQFTQLGSDTGYDCISNYTPSNKIISFLDDVSMGSGLPKTILYSLNPNDNPIIDSIIGSFQNSDVAGKIQHGSAWWFNDNKKGIEEQLTSLANLGVLGKFVGMLTDSRSFLSYTRHDYFRRILCNTIGNWVENGYYPADDESLSKIVKGIAYFNAKYYFNF